MEYCWLAKHCFLTFFCNIIRQLATLFIDNVVGTPSLDHLVQPTGLWLIMPWKLASHASFLAMAALVGAWLLLSLVVISVEDWKWELKLRIVEGVHKPFYIVERIVALKLFHAFTSIMKSMCSFSCIYCFIIRIYVLTIREWVTQELDDKFLIKLQTLWMVIQIYLC